MKKIAIIIPAYNEEKRIRKTLNEYCRYFEKNKFSKTDVKIIVVANNCNDKTVKILEELKKKFENLEYLDLEKGGKGFAITEGYVYALKKDYDFIGFVDADLATSPKEFNKLINSLVQSSFDGVIADRYIKGSKVYPSFGFRRIVVSRIFNFIVRALFLFSYRDTQCGAKLFKKDVIKKVIKEITISQWAYDIGFLYACKKNGFKIRSIPTVWYEMPDSKLNISKASVEMFFAVIQLKILVSRFKRLLTPIKPLISIIYKYLKNRNN